jgi:acetolactate synthase-1/2/3 large subunit
MAEPSQSAASGHGGVFTVEALRRFGVAELFTLSGGHIFPFYDAALDQGVRIVDVRHESTATFAAEGTAKLTRRPGVAALTAGPGETNGVSAVTSAWFNGSPLVVLGGRAPQARWGAGSLQEFDHVPVLAPITKRSATVTSVEAIGRDVVDAVALAAAPHRGPVFLDFPLDVVFAEGESVVPDAPTRPTIVPDADEVARAAALLAGARRPALIAGTDVYWEGAWDALRELVESMRVPTFVNGLGRGCLPADHPLAFSRTRGMLKTDADVVVVVGTPLDFRISFGSFGDAQVIHIVDSPSQRAGHVAAAASPAGDIAGPAIAPTTSRGSAGWPRPSERPRRPRPKASWPTPRRSSRRGSTARCARSSIVTPSWCATAGTSSPTPASTSTRSSPVAGSTPGRTAVSAPASATPWRPGWPVPTSR